MYKTLEYEPNYDETNAMLYAERSELLLQSQPITPAQRVFKCTSVYARGGGERIPSLLEKISSVNDKIKAAKFSFAR